MGPCKGPLTAVKACESHLDFDLYKAVKANINVEHVYGNFETDYMVKQIFSSFVLIGLKRIVGKIKMFTTTSKHLSMISTNSMYGKINTYPGSLN